VQVPTDLVTTPSNTWYFLKMEGESYVSKTAADDVGFTRAFGGDARTDALGNPILADNTPASKKGALFTQTIFSQWADKATYYVQFSRPGTYYLYMRFSMFENGGNFAHYLNEDSFFLPPDFGKDPQNDWPIPQPTPSGQSGGYVEGCCGSAGYLFFPSVGDPTRVSFQSDTNLFEGNNFVWNDLISSQFMPPTVGEAGVPFKYEITPDKVGHPLSFTIGYREGGTTIDMFLFSTSSNLMTTYTSAEIDDLLVNPKLRITSVSSGGGNVTVNWTGEPGVLLQKTANLSNPASWTNIPSTAGNSSYTEPLTSTPTFYRLYRQ